MSDCGGLFVAALAAPLLLAVLLVAGVTYVALQGARLVGHLVLEGLQLAGTGLASGVRTIAQSARAAGTQAMEAAARGAQWAGGLYDSLQAGERLRGGAQTAYHSALQALQAPSRAGQASLHLNTPSATSGHTSLEGLAGPLVPQPTSLTASAATGRLGAPSGGRPAPAAPGGVPLQAADPGAPSGQPALEALARAQAVDQALRQELPLSLVAEQWHADRLRAARVEMDTARSLLQAGRPEEAEGLAQHAEATLTTLTYQSHQRLVAAERATLVATVGNTLEDLGYSNLRVAQAKGRTALVGRRGEHTLALVAGPGGKLQMDMAGFEGDSCRRETQRLLEGLHRNGLELSRVELTHHGRREGGALLRRAQRSDQPLAQALAELAGEAQSAPANATPPVKRGTRLSGPTEEECLRRARIWLWSASQQLPQRGGR